MRFLNVCGRRSGPVKRRFVLNCALGQNFSLVNRKVSGEGNCPVKLSFFSPREVKAMITGNREYSGTQKVPESPAFQQR